MQILQSVKPSQPKALILVRLRGIRERDRSAVSCPKP